MSFICPKVWKYLKWNPLKKRLALTFLLLLMSGSMVMGMKGFPLEKDKEPDTTFVHDRPALRKAVPMVRTRRVDNLNHIYQFEHSELGQRVPVVLLPGRAEEFQRSSWWKKIRKMTKKNKAFKQHYKLYAFIYDSTEEVEEQADDYVRELKAYFGDLPAVNRQVIAISYSLGGMILREAMMDKEIDQLTKTVYAVAVPFHGSPMFDTEWFTKYLRPPNHSPIRKLWDQAVFSAYMMGKDNLKRGLHWSNFDGSKPMYEKAELNGDMLISPVYSYTPHPAERVLKEKVVIYTSYLENQYTEASEKGVSKIIEKPFQLPKAVLGSVLPIYGKSVHSVFSYMNAQLATLPTYDPEHPKGVESHLYRYNDGVFPITSMLYLPAQDKPYNENFSELVDFIDVKKARVFVNIDHMHIGEYALFKKRIRTEDALHPEDGERTPNEWLIYDLLKQAPELQVNSK